MTPRNEDSDHLLDRITREIAATRLDGATEREITGRVWRRLTDETPDARPLRSCRDFERHIPDYASEKLSPRLALLVEDHVRHCVGCRRALLRERGELHEAGTRILAARRRRPMRRLLPLAAAAALVLATVTAVRLVGDALADRNLRAEVLAIDGSLQLIDGPAVVELDEGKPLRARQVVRTAAESGAVLRLADGSLVELDERSQVFLRASRRGTDIRLQRGNLLVRAADQHGGRLFVSTADCRVAVQGTIFSVNHGLKGSRVAVLEGAVEVRGPTVDTVLQPGEQLTTNQRLEPVPLEQEFAWSRDAKVYRELIRELSSLRRAVTTELDQSLPRTSTFLLDLAPEDTFIYAAVPNISDGVDDARAALESRVAASPLLRDWWQAQVVDSGIEHEVWSLLERLQPIGEALGAEAVVAVPRSVLAGRGAPLFMAEVDRPEALRADLQRLVDESSPDASVLAHVAIVVDPRATTVTDADLVIWVSEKLVAASVDLEPLIALADRIEDGSPLGVSSTRLHERLRDVYAGGVSWLLAADVGVAVDHSASEMSPQQATLLEQLGIMDLSTLVIERHRDGDWYATDAELAFSQPRRGVVAWLAEPAPLGGLEFVSPDAFAVVSGATRDPASMLDELIGVIADQEPAAWSELEEVQRRIGIDLRNDILAALGGELTLALDGPMLPVPSWKCILEIRDPAALRYGLERGVAAVNRALESHQQPLLHLDEIVSAGRTYLRLVRDGLGGEVVMTPFDGYLIVGPTTAVVEHAIAQKLSSVGLADSQVFRTLVPANNHSDCSAIVYRNLQGLDRTLDALPAELVQEIGEAAALGADLGTGMLCLYAESDRITVAATGGGISGVGEILGLGTSLGFADSTLADRVGSGDSGSAGGPKPVSSAG